MKTCDKTHKYSTNIVYAIDTYWNGARSVSLLLIVQNTILHVFDTEGDWHGRKLYSLYNFAVFVFYNIVYKLTNTKLINFLKKSITTTLRGKYHVYMDSSEQHAVGVRVVVSIT